MTGNTRTQVKRILKRCSKAKCVSADCG